MSYIGLGKGFVIFGTLAHKVLLTMSDGSRWSLPALSEEIGGYADVSAILGRLVQHGYIYKVGIERKTVGRSHALYSLTPSRVRSWPKALTALERSQKSRAKRKRNEVLERLTFLGQRTREHPSEERCTQRPAAMDV